MHYTYKPHGVCSRQIDFDIIDNKIYNIEFKGGCNGNAQGIGLLAEGMDKNEVIKRLRGVNCAGRGTSCPDQLSIAIESAQKSNKE